MALIKFEYDFKNDIEHFESLYKMTYEEFMEYYGDDNIVIDLSDKIIISLSADSYKNLPVDLLTLFISEEEKYNYKATLIYSGHIAFIKIEYTDGSIRYFYKDDECCPCSYDELMESEDDVIYCCEEKGFGSKDILSQIEKTIQGLYDYNYNLDKDKLIILQGL